MPVLTGFKVGVGISIAVGQLPALLGVEKQGDRIVTQIWYAVTSLPQASVTTVALAVGCIALLLGLKRWLPAIPGPLVVVVLSIAASALFRLQDHGIGLAGTVPSGLPLPGLPPVLDHLDLIGPALGIALVGFVESISAARTFQSRSDPPVAADRELGALGLANVVSSLLRGMPAGGGMSQTAVADGAGAKSPLTAVFGSVTVVVTLLFLAPVFSDLPQATLGPLVFVAAIGLVDVGKVREIFATDRRDGILTVLAAAGVAAMGALDGIVIAVLISVLTLLYEMSRRRLEVLRVVPVEAAVNAPVPDGLLVLRPGAEVYFANVQNLRRDIRAAVAAAPDPPRVVLLDASTVSVFEYSAHEALRLLIDDLLARGLVVWEVSPPPDAEAAAARYRQAHGDPGLRRFPSLEAAVAAYVDEVAPESR